MGSRTTSLVLAMLMLTGTLIAPAIADDPGPPSSDEPVWEWPEPLPPQDDDIIGSSQLDISGLMRPSSNISASWNANVSLRDDYGVELLPDRTLGVRAQIDQHLGDGDGWLSISEIADFVILIENARNLTDSEMLGCCIFDYFPMQIGLCLLYTSPSPRD